MNDVVLLVQSATAAPLASESMSPEVAIALAALLLLLACAMAITEFLIVSWGMLLVGSVVSSAAAIALAFSASPIAGWIFVCIVPILAVFVVRFGFKLMGRNRAMILPTEVREDAGYHHVAEQSGVGIGAIGVLVTSAVPSGRARFTGKTGEVELDVQVQGAVLARGDRVIIFSIAGPAITVGPASATTNPTASRI